MKIKSFFKVFSVIALMGLLVLAGFEAKALVDSLQGQTNVFLGLMMNSYRILFVLFWLLMCCNIFACASFDCEPNEITIYMIKGKTQIFDNIICVLLSIFYFVYGFKLANLNVVAFFLGIAFAIDGVVCLISNIHAVNRYNRGDTPKIEKKPKEEKSKQSAPTESAPVAQQTENVQPQENVSIEENSAVEQTPATPQSPAPEDNSAAAFINSLGDKGPGAAMGASPAASLGASIMPSQPQSHSTIGTTPPTNPPMQ